MKIVTTSVRLPKEMVEEIERLSKKEGINKETLIRKHVAESPREYEIKRVLDLYKEGKVSLEMHILS